MALALASHGVSSRPFLMPSLSQSFHSSVQTLHCFGVSAVGLDGAS